MNPFLKKSCSIVIRAYNEEEHIGRLLTGIMQQSFKDFEIVLVDSGSTDATTAIASRYPVKIIHIKPEDFTFGYSLNQGVAAAHNPFIVIASAHVYPVYPDWLAQLMAPFEDPEVALTYGRQRGGRTSKFSEHQIFARWFPDIPQLRQKHPFCNNANAAIRRTVWETHHYDETLTGLEDLAWASWAMEQGYAISYVPEAEIIHLHDETPRQVYNRYRREAMAFKQIFTDEGFSRWDFIRLASTNIFNDLWHAGKGKQLGAHWRSIFWFRLMQFWGTYMGYRNTSRVTDQLRQTFYYPSGLESPTPLDRGIQPIQYHERS